MSDGIYLDHNATTPLDKRVLEKMLPYFTEEFGNPASIDHIHGNTAKKAVDDARAKIAKVFGCRRDSEIIFTSGATESNNIALIGAYRKYRNKGNHIISTAIEHSSISDTLEHLKTEGAEVTLVSVDEYGRVDPEKIKAAISDNTILISVMFANNEIGTIQPIKELGAIAKEREIIFHCDAAQAAGHEKINAYDLGIDLMSFSAHKFYGPKGTGGLFIRSFSPMIRLSPILHGGGHERGLRPGTLNVPGIVGMAEALVFTDKERKESNKAMSAFRNKIYNELKDAFPEIKLNGHPKSRLAHNLSITIPGVESKAILHKLRGQLSFSSGSACTTTKADPSHVLKAIGRTDEESYQSIRIGLGKFTETDPRIIKLIINTIIDLK